MMKEFTFALLGAWMLMSAGTAGGQDPDGKTMADIFISRYDGGTYKRPEKLDPAVSSENLEHSPSIAPDGSYLIFSRASRKRAQMGIFISFKKKDGRWGEAVCLNDIVGCPTATQCTSLTHDGKYIFYLSWGSTRWVCYWRTSDFIETLRPENQPILSRLDRGSEVQGRVVDSDRPTIPGMPVLAEEPPPRFSRGFGIDHLDFGL